MRMVYLIESRYTILVRNPQLAFLACVKHADDGQAVSDFKIASRIGEVKMEEDVRSKGGWDQRRKE